MSYPARVHNRRKEKRPRQESDALRLSEQLRPVEVKRTAGSQDCPGFAKLGKYALDDTENPVQNKLAMHLSRRCGARTRNGSPCRSAAMPNGRCRMHGGMSPGAPKGNKNAFKHGHYTAEAIASRREIAKLLRDARALVKQGELG